MPNKPTTRERIAEAITANGPLSVPELGEHLDMSSGTVRSCLADWRKRDNCPVGVVSWQRRARGYVPVYGFSDRPDATKPKLVRKPRKAVCRDYYLKHRQRVLAKHRAKRGSAMTNNPFAGLIAAAGATHQAGRNKK